jgi:hypothetical protein
MFLQKQNLQNLKVLKDRNFKSLLLDLSFINKKMRKLSHLFVLSFSVFVGAAYLTPVFKTFL